VGQDGSQSLGLLLGKGDKLYRLILALALVLSACGGDSTSSTDSLASEAETTTLATATTAASTTTQPPITTTTTTEAPTTSTQAPLGPVTAEDLVGIWRTQEAPSFHQYHEDGTSRAALTLEMLEDDDKVHALGTFTIEGNLFTQIEGDKDRACKAGERGTYEIGMLESGRVRYFLIEDECDHRASFPVVSMIRVPDPD